MTPELWKRYRQPMADEVMLSHYGAPLIASLRVEIVQHLGEPLGSTLCVGCGDGTELKFFKGVGVTLNTKNLRDQHTYVCADMHALPFKDKSFDGVFCKDCFEHALAPSIVLHEFVRVARKWIFLAIPSEGWETSPLHPLLLTSRQITVLAFKEAWDTYYTETEVKPQPGHGAEGLPSWNLHCYLLKPSSLSKEDLEKKLCPKSL